MPAPPVPKKRTASAERSTTSVAENIRAAAIRKYTAKDGTCDIQSTEQFLDQVYGLPLHGNLALQFLLGVDVLPLSRVFTITGPAASTKTSLAWYFGQLVALYMGSGVFLDAEKKTNPDQVLAMIGHERLLDLFLKDKGIQTVEDMRDKLLYYMSLYVQACPKGTEPYILILDSLNAFGSEEMQAKLEKGEALGYTGAKRAQTIQTVLQTLIPRYVANYPILLAMVNHQTVDLKQEGAGPAGYSQAPPEPKEAGGTFKEYAYTYKLECRERKRAKRYFANGSCYRLIQIGLGKNSLGSRRPPILVPYRSEWSEDGLQEFIWYDWNEALALLLTEKNAMVSQVALKEILELSVDGSKYSSAVLGLKNATPTEVGAAIHSNPKLVEALQHHVLRIRIKRKLVAEARPIQISRPPTLPAAEGFAPAGDEGEKTEDAVGEGVQDPGAADTSGLSL